MTFRRIDQLYIPLKNDECVNFIYVTSLFGLKTGKKWGTRADVYIITFDKVGKTFWRQFVREYSAQGLKCYKELYPQGNG